MTAPGWYQSPMDPDGTQRWWDGWNWTDRVHAPRPASARPRPVASIPHRVAARSVDFGLAMLLASALNRVWLPRVLPDEKVATGWLSAEDLLPEGLAPTALLATVAVFVLWELYWLLAEGATPGKQLLGLFVSDPTSQRGTVEALPAIKRNLHRAIAVVPFGWALVAITTIASLVLMQTDPARRQSLMDRFAATTVHRLPSGSPRFTPWLRVWASLYVTLRLAAWILN